MWSAFNFLIPETYSQVCQVFQFGQVRELQVERVHNEPAINRDGNDDNPKHCHGDVVEENQIVDDGEE